MACVKENYKLSLHERWSRFVRQTFDLERPGLLKQIDSWFVEIPESLRVGPWAWAPTILLGAMYFLSVLMAPKAIAAYDPMPQADDIWLFRFIGFLYAFAIVGYAMYSWGVWVMSSWTLLGCFVSLVRCFAGLVGLSGLQRVLTFPALMSNAVTVLLWYTAIVPGLVAFSPREKRLDMIKFLVCSFMLINVHGVNLPLTILDWYVQPVRLNLFDLWVGVVYALSYNAFYQAVMDPLGLHFYFILSPRKWWAAFVFAGIIALVVSIFGAYNILESWVTGSVEGSGLAGIFF